MPKSNRVPSYLLHKRTGHARCYVNGREVFLGRHNSPESLEKYRRLLAELAAASVPDAKPSCVYESLSIVQLLSAYYDFAVAYYGARSDSMDTIRAVAKPLRVLYGRTAASDFGPLKLKALRQWMISQGWYRATINKRVQAVRRIFKWAASEELIPPSVFQALQTVEGLHKGRSVAPESKPRKPVPEADYKAALRKLPAVVADMVQVQRLTGARPTEICDMRPGDIDRSGPVWLYRPPVHKGAHRDKVRTICVGPRAQRILRPYLLRAADAYCFSPQESEDRRLAKRRADRKTPLSCGNRPGSRKKSSRKRKLRLRFDKDSYRRCITRACERARVPRWSPHQLRHSAGTEIRQRFGLDAAQVVLGHATANITQVYTQRDLALAAKVAAEVG